MRNLLDFTIQNIYPGSEKSQKSFCWVSSPWPVPGRGPGPWWGVGGRGAGPLVVGAPRPGASPPVAARSRGRKGATAPGRRKAKNRGSTTPKVPESSLTSVLIWPVVAYLPKSDGMGSFQPSMDVPDGVARLGAGPGAAVVAPSLARGRPPRPGWPVSPVGWLAGWGWPARPWAAVAPGGGRRGQGPHRQVRLRPGVPRTRSPSN